MFMKATIGPTHSLKNPMDSTFGYGNGRRARICGKPCMARTDTLPGFCPPGAPSVNLMFASGFKISDTDIWRAANMMIELYAGDAAVRAAMRADAVLAEGDTEGFFAW